MYKAAFVDIGDCQKSRHISLGPFDSKLGVGLFDSRQEGLKLVPHPSEWIVMATTLANPFAEASVRAKTTNTQ